MADQSGWVESDTKTNAIATATKAAASGKTHIVHSVDASFDSATAGILLQIKDGSTIKWSMYVHDSQTISFPRGITMTKGVACSAVLAASGGAAQSVSLHGITK